MAGILNNKTRIFDTVLTTEGRRQLAAGTFKIEFASFSDSATFYQGDVASGSADAGARIFFEAATNLGDQITFETDDSGNLISFGKSGGAQVVGKKVYITGSSANPDNFASTAAALLKTSIDNFKNLHALGTKDDFLETQNFKVSRNSVDFILTDKRPINVSRDVTAISVDDAESFYLDKRLAHIPNYKYLPPVNKGTSDPIGNYSCRGQREITSYGQLLQQLKGREKVEITFPSTSRENNIVTQMFELSNEEFLKFDIIDYGEFQVDEERPNKHVYFVGKIYLDSFNSPTFINMFTLVFD